jgi:uncharacterized protein YciI
MRLLLSCTGCTLLKQLLLGQSSQLGPKVRGISSSVPLFNKNKYWVLQYKYDPNNLLERRAPWRPQHLALAREYADKGMVLMGGAYADPIDGALILFHGEKADVEEFVRKDPYASNGIATDPVIREWTVMVGTKL